MKSDAVRNGSAVNPDLLIAEARSGADAALNRLIELLAEQLWAEFGDRKLRGMSPSRTVSDLIQETLIRAREQFGRFNKETFSEFKQWARGILYLRYRHLNRTHRNRASERVKRKIWQAATLRNNLPNHERPSKAAEDKLERREEAARAFAVFQALKPHEQTVIQLRAIDELSFGQIALMVNSTEGAVARAFSRAMSRLRKQFEPHDTT